METVAQYNDRTAAEYPGREFRSDIKLQPDISCEQCGRKMRSVLDEVCTSYPPQVRLVCECGHKAWRLW